MFRFIVFLALSSTSVPFAFGADYETTVSEKIFNSSSKITISQDDIKKSGAENVTQLLSTQANISFYGDGIKAISGIS